MMSARGRPLRPAWSRRSPQCRGRLVPHPLRQWGKVRRAASARQQQDRLRSTLGRGEIQYAQWPTFNVRRGGVCRHRPLLPPPPCRRSCAELRGGFLGEVWRGAAGRVAARSGHGGRAHMGGMSMMMGMVRSRGRCGGRGGCEVDACGPSTIDRLSTHRAPSDDCACSCCGTEGWVSAAGIVWDWAGSESGQA